MCRWCYRVGEVGAHVLEQNLWQTHKPFQYQDPSELRLALHGVGNALVRHFPTEWTGRRSVVATRVEWTTTYERSELSNVSKYEREMHRERGHTHTEREREQWALVWGWAKMEVWVDEGMWGIRSGHFVWADIMNILRVSKLERMEIPMIPPRTRCTF